MQFKQIALAVAATLVAGHAAAAAVTQADIVAARSNGTLQEAWLSGASAPTFNVFDGFSRGCDSGTQAIFTNATTAGKPGSIGNFMGYACTRGGVVTAMYHTVDGGSFNAYAPHLTGTAPDGTSMPAQLRRVRNLGTVSCTGSGTWNSIPVRTGCAIAVGATVGDSAPALPAGGFSDVEASLFGVDVSAAGTEADANVSQVFGLAVTKNLYRELQVAQGIYASVAAATSADPSYDPANAPNITKAQYTSIVELSGGYQTDWNPILKTITNPNAGVGKNVYLARRVATSGTQASSNAFFLNNPCAAGAAGSVTPATAADSSGTFIVTEGSGTGNVKTTMTNAGNAGNFAIGVVSVENNWRTDAAASEGYRFVKVDGVHPEAGDTTFGRTTSINGGYAFQMEMKSFVASTAAGTFGETLIGEISSALGNPANCADVPRGLFLNPAGGSSCTVGTEVGKGTKFGNNCSPVQMFF